MMDSCRNQESLLCCIDPERLEDTIVSRFGQAEPCQNGIGRCSSVVERTLGKGEVAGSSPASGFVCPVGQTQTLRAFFPDSSGKV